MTAKKVIEMKPRKMLTTHSHMDTMVLEMRTLNGWKIPPFQRPLRINEKVRAIADQIRADGGVIPGVLTIGVLRGGGRDDGEYIVDGQHRVEAFRLSGCNEALADVRRVDYENMAQMGEAFVQLNSQTGAHEARRHPARHRSIDAAADGDPFALPIRWI